MRLWDLSPSVWRYNGTPIEILHLVPGLLGPKPFRPETPRPGRFGPFSIRDCSAHLSETARPNFIYFILFLFIFYLFFFGGEGGGGGVIVFFSVYVHQNKIPETLFNVIIFFRQGNTETI